MADEKESNLNFGYGQLNKISRTNVGPMYDPIVTSGVDTLKNQVASEFQYDTINSLGQLRGICIGIVPLYASNVPDSWINRIFRPSGENPNPLLAIKVRIPFMDSMLQDPFSTTPPLDWSVVRTYNTFVAANEEISRDIPSIGDIVNVDYEDRTTRTGGIYLGKVFENPIGLDIQESSKKYFDAAGNRLIGHEPTATNGYIGPAWVPDSPGSLQNKCQRGTPPNTGGKSFSLRGFVKGQQYTFEATKVGAWIMDVRAATDFIRMRDAASRANPPVNIRIVSAFRTMQEQEHLYCKYKNEGGNAANPPGHSNHQSGVALDFNTIGLGGSKTRGTGVVYEWLAKNAETFGFKRIATEHWHWEHQPSLLGRNS